MVVQLDAQLEATIKEKIESGFYEDSNAVIREALRLLDDHEKLEQLRVRLDSGLAQIERGEVIPFTSDLVSSMKQEAKRRAAAGMRPDPDVCP